MILKQILILKENIKLFNSAVEYNMRVCFSIATEITVHIPKHFKLLLFGLNSF